MTTTLEPTTTNDLPHWETIPDDIPAAIREIKAAIRAQIEKSSGKTVEQLFAEVENFIKGEVDDIVATQARGESVWPVIEFSDIVKGTVTEQQRAYLKRRGCAVIKGVFPREQAEAWDADVVNYVDSNNFMDVYTGPADDFFADVMSKPEIYPIYWSHAQMEARTHDNMAKTQSFLNSFWNHTDEDGKQWFDPDRDSLYPDRIRRRPPGANSGGLATHLDPGTLDLWMTEGYQNYFRHLFHGDFERYSPWEAAYRTEANQYPGTTMCSAFRTFQGWTALSEMEHDQGVLHTVPIPAAMAYLMLRPLLNDVPDDEMCGVAINRTFPANEKYHPLLMQAQAGIPDVVPGDTVWWHCDMIHAVAPVTDQKGWGNVIYIPAAPWCKKNADYAASVRDAFEKGKSPSDFPDENYEANWSNRFQVSELNTTGRRGMDLPV